MRSTGALTNGSVNYICQSCKAEELIPLDVVEHFDFLDGGAPLDPPKFSCQNCHSEMVPEYFRSHTGIVYDNRAGVKEDKQI